MCSLRVEQPLELVIVVGPATPSTVSPYLRWNAFRRCRRQLIETARCGNLETEGRQIALQDGDVGALHAQREHAASETRDDDEEVLEPELDFVVAAA